jgi:hypothetical protein
VRISARKVASVAASTSRPLGPAAAEASAPELHLAVEDAVSTAIIHHEKHEIRGLTAQLQTDASALECDQGGRSPSSTEGLAGSAGHNPAAITTADAEREFEH